MDGSRGGEGGGAGGLDPLKNHKNIEFHSITGPDPLKNQANIQCWAISGPPAKRHLKRGVLPAGLWCPTFCGH